MDEVSEVEYWWTELRYAIDLWVQNLVADLFGVILIAILLGTVAAFVAIPLATVVSAAGAVGGHTSPGSWVKWWGMITGILFGIVALVAVLITALLQFSGF